MFDLDGLYAGISALPIGIEKAIEFHGKTVAAKMEGQAKRERPWRDRSTHARQRLKGYVVRYENGIRIYLAHGVSYGVHLEFKNEKRYAVVYPTLRETAPTAMQGLSKLLGGK